MVTLGIALLLEALSERFSNITGGTDGLQGIEMQPILGLFAFDMFGKTGFWYCLIVLFLLFPRVQGPLWGLPQDAYAGVSGLSDSMAPGNISQLALSDAIAFRAEFDGEPPAQRQLYWRGPVLWEFDGRTWLMGGQFLARYAPPETGGMSAISSPSRTVASRSTYSRLSA